MKINRPNGFQHTRKPPNCQAQVMPLLKDVKSISLLR